MQDIGDLDGGPVGGQPTGVSADGDVVVGFGNSANGGEAFRWMQESGMVGLGDFPGGPFYSVAYATNADGSVVVGYSWAVPQTQGNRSTAFIWDANHGMRDLKQVLLDMGVSVPANWLLTEAADISDDGRTIVGRSVNTQGITQAFLVRLNRAGDVNADGVVDISDLFDVINAWGPCSGTCLEDAFPAIAGDGTVDISDLFAVINNWDV